MSNELNNVELTMEDFDKPVTVDESAPAFTIISDYGVMQYFGGIKVTLAGKGDSGWKVQVPGLVVEGKQFERGGMKEGHTEGKRNAIAHFIRFDGLSFTDDKPFSRVLVFTTATTFSIEAEKLDKYPVIELTEAQQKTKAEGKPVWLSDWSNLQLPAIKTMPASAREKFIKKERIPFKADNWNVGKPGREDTQGRVKQDGTPKMYFDHYWFNFTIFPDEAAMLVARAAAKGTNGTGADYGHYPVQWATAPGQLVTFVKGEFNKGVGKAQIVADAMLTGESINGGKVDEVALLREILASETPGPLLESWLAA